MQLFMFTHIIQKKTIIEISAIILFKDNTIITNYIIYQSVQGINSSPSIILLTKGVGTYANPGMLERLVRTDSFRGIHRQHLVNEIFGLWRHSIPLWGRVLKKNGFFVCLLYRIFLPAFKIVLLTYIISSRFDLSIQPMLVLVPKWRVSHQKYVQDNTACPNIYSLSIWLFFKHLGTQVSRSTSES